MKLIYKILVVAVAISLCVLMALPVFAITITGFTDINIADYVSGKEYEGDEVIVTYDMPLHPYSEYFGTKADGTEGIFATSTNIYFTQEAEDNTINSYKELIDFGAITVTDEYWSSGKYSNLDRTAYTHAMVNGVLYEMTRTDDTMFCTYTFGPYILKLFQTSSTNEWFSFTTSLDGTYDLSIGTYTEITQQIYEYSRFGADLWPLGYNNGSIAVVDISDIREGANFDLTFSYKCRILTDGTTSDPTPSFSVHYLDENGNQVYKSDEYLQIPIDSDYDTSFEHTVTFTVPEGASYFYLRFDTSLMEVKTCRKIDWDFKNLTMTCALSALEEESEALAEISVKLDQLMNGNPYDQQEANDFKDNAGGQADKLDGLNDKIQNLQKPQLNAGDISVNDYVNPSQILTTMPFLTVLFDNELPLTMIMLVLTVGLCAYALFGKRG